MKDDKTKVLIVDDSPVSRDLMKHVLNSDPQVEVVGTVKDGVEALEFIENNPVDLVFTDIVMPRMDGFELTQKIMKKKPIPVIAVSGVYSREEIARGFKVIDAGAVTILEKPKGLNDATFYEATKFVLETLRALTHIQTIKKNGTESTRVTKPLPEQLKHRKPDLKNVQAMAIGAAIGGPKSLQKLLSSLPVNIGIPIFIVQHIVPGFVEGFADWLAKSTKLKVCIAKQGERALPGGVYIAPDKTHLEILPGNIISLVEDKSHCPYVPSAGRLFRSLANIYGSNCVGVLLLGAEKDGARDLCYMNDLGALTIAEEGIDVGRYGAKRPEELPQANFDEISRSISDMFHAAQH